MDSPEAAPHHENTGSCDHCRFIIDRYPGIHSGLRDWFYEFQRLHPEGHISCAGRGQLDQEALRLRGASKARWKQSAHNWNCALDLFCLIPNVPNIYFHGWFTETLAPALPDFLKWYGRPGSPFYELPHVEVADWTDLAREGQVDLVSR